MNGPALGALVESAVVAELEKILHHGRGGGRLFHWQSPSAEVDIVVEVEPAAVRYRSQGDQTPSPRHADRLARWCDLTGGRGILACRADHAHTLGRGIRAAPWHLC